MAKTNMSRKRTMSKPKHKKGLFHGEASPFMLRRHPDFLEFVLGDA